MIPAQYDCLGGGTPQVTGDLYPWVGSFRSGTELWCTVDGMYISCRRDR